MRKDSKKFLQETTWLHVRIKKSDAICLWNCRVDTRRLYTKFLHISAKKIPTGSSESGPTISHGWEMNAGVSVVPDLKESYLLCTLISQPRKRKMLDLGSWLKHREGDQSPGGCWSDTQRAEIKDILEWELCCHWSGADRFPDGFRCLEAISLIK